MIRTRQYFEHSWLFAARFFVASMVMAAGLLASADARAESIKVGMLRTTSSGPMYIAIEKRLFAAEDLQVEIVFFDSPQPVAVATVSGDIDIGATGLSP
jgi:NitT/TauT family transport system substrate-binding protein